MVFASVYLGHWMFCYAHLRDMDATQYAHVNIPPCVAVAWTAFSTHHKDINAPQYVQADVPSSYL